MGQAKPGGEVARGTAAATSRLRRAMVAGRSAGSRGAAGPDQLQRGRRDARAGGGGPSPSQTYDVRLREDARDVAAVAGPDDSVVRSPDGRHRAAVGRAGGAARPAATSAVSASRLAASSPGGISVTACRCRRNQRQGGIGERAQSRGASGPRPSRSGQIRPARAGVGKSLCAAAVSASCSGDRAAEGVADQLEAVDAERADRGRDVSGVCGDVGRGGEVGATEAGEIERDARAVRAWSRSRSMTRRSRRFRARRRSGSPRRATRAQAACAPR